MKVTIIDYKAGNVRSVDFALQRLGISATLRADKEVLQSDKIIFPGVGHAESAMQQLIKCRLRYIYSNTQTASFRNLLRNAASLLTYRRRRHKRIGNI